MNKWLHKWRAGLGSGYSSAFSPYWRALPMQRMTKPLMGTFFYVAGVGFAVDLLQINHPRLGHSFFWPIFAGAMAAGISASANWRRLLERWAREGTLPLPPRPHPRTLRDLVLPDRLAFILGDKAGSK
jgi:hypothetical protein